VKKIFFLIGFLIALTSCTIETQPIPTMETLPEGEKTQAYLPNPASVFCEDQGYFVEIRSDEEGNQYGFCIFPDGIECDEWAYFRGECAPDRQKSSAPSSTEIPTPMPINPEDYTGWWEYSHPECNFTVMLPEDWEVEETRTSDPLLAGHILNLHPKEISPVETAASQNIRMTFRQVGEDVPLWPTGVGEGEFIEQGILEVNDQPARRVLLVCPSGEVTAIWYHDAEENQPNILRGGMEFAFIYTAGSHCEPEMSLIGKTQYTGELIIASLVP